MNQTKNTKKQKAQERSADRRQDLGHSMSRLVSLLSCIIGHYCQRGGRGFYYKLQQLISLALTNVFEGNTATFDRCYSIGVFFCAFQLISYSKGCAKIHISVTLLPINEDIIRQDRRLQTSYSQCNIYCFHAMITKTSAMSHALRYAHFHRVFAQKRIKIKKIRDT